MFLSHNCVAIKTMELIDAIQTANVELLRDYFTNRLKINEPLLDGQTPLVYAIKSESCNAVECLIKLGANVNHCHGKSTSICQNVMKEATPLQVALDMKSARMVYVLMKNGCRPGASRVSLHTVLHRAIKWNSVELVQFIIKQVIEEDSYMAQSGFDLSMHLLTAVKDNNTRITNAFLELGCSPNQAHENMVPIVIAANNNNMRMCQLLINYGALVNKHNKTTLGQMNTPLGMAICAGMSQAIKRLITLGSTVNSTIDWSITFCGQTAAPGSSMLHLAILKQNKQIVEYLLDAGADISLADNSGDTVFHLSCKDKSKTGIEILKLLLARNNEWGHRIVDLDTRDNSGWTPLTICAKSGNVEAMHCLVTYGANPLLRYNRSPSALHAAVESENLQMVDLLLSYGCDVNGLAQGLTPLHIALRLGNEALCLRLLELGADMHKLSQDPVLRSRDAGTPCLHMAVMSGREAVVRRLLDCGVELEAESWLGETALMLAALHSDTTILELLLRHGALMNSPGRHKQPALSRSIRHQHYHNAQTLIRHGADVNKPKKRGESPLYWAAHHGSGRVVQLLLNAGARSSPALIAAQCAARCDGEDDNMMRAAVLHYLHCQALCVRSLQAMARLVIRRHLAGLTHGTSIMERLQPLPLPPALLRFLTMDSETLVSDDDLKLQYQAHQTTS